MSEQDSHRIRVQIGDLDTYTGDSDKELTDLTSRALQLMAKRGVDHFSVDIEAVDDRNALIDSVAEAIRTADGNHTMGAGALAEVAVDRVLALLGQEK